MYALLVEDKVRAKNIDLSHSVICMYAHTHITYIECMYIHILVHKFKQEQLIQTCTYYIHTMYILCTYYVHTMYILCTYMHRRCTMRHSTTAHQLTSERGGILWWQADRGRKWHIQCRRSRRGKCGQLGAELEQAGQV